MTESLIIAAAAIALFVATLYVRPARRRLGVFGDRTLDWKRVRCR